MRRADCVRLNLSEQGLREGRSLLHQPRRPPRAAGPLQPRSQEKRTIPAMSNGSSAARATESCTPASEIPVGRVSRRSDGVPSAGDLPAQRCRADMPRNECRARISRTVAMGRDGAVRDESARTREEQRCAKLAGGARRALRVARGRTMSSGSMRRPAPFEAELVVTCGPAVRSILACRAPSQDAGVPRHPRTRMEGRR